MSKTTENILIVDINILIMRFRNMQNLPMFMLQPNGPYRALLFPPFYSLHNYKRIISLNLDTNFS